jgi:hypothetical protein
MINKHYPCPCCGYLTIEGMPPGTFEICPVCFWEDDNVQFEDIDFEGGANKESLRQARMNFKKYRVFSLEFIKNIRNPFPSEIPQ